MKTVSKIYLFITSLFFLFSPFSLGLVIIYFEDTNLEEYGSGLIVNLVLLLILGTVIAFNISKKKLAVPNQFEIKLLLFGLLSNIVIYFYVFQNSLNIDYFMTIYFTIILVLLLYLLIIDRTNLNYELWIFAILFFIVDFIHYQYISSHDMINQIDYINANFIQRIFYYSVPLATLTLFVAKIRNYKVIDTYAYVFITVTALITLVFVQGIDVEDKFVLTLNLLIPFIIITDFIISIIYKRFNVYKITFYIRMGTIIMLIYIYDGVLYFVMNSYSDHNMYEMVMIIYIVLICNIIEFLVPNKKIS